MNLLEFANDESASYTQAKDIWRRVGGAVMESRFESLFTELENAITDYRGLLRQREGSGQNKNALPALHAQIHKLNAENNVLRERQEVVCLRLSELLAQVSCWENEL